MLGGKLLMQSKTGMLIQEIMGEIILSEDCLSYVSTYVKFVLMQEYLTML